MVAKITSSKATVVLTVALVLQVGAVHHHTLGPALQAVLYPVKSAPVPAMGCQLLQQNTVGNSVKGFAEV